MSDVSDSVYKEAVTKLKILLSATEHPTLKIGDLRQSGEDKSRSLDQLFSGERGPVTPRREPLFTRLPPKHCNSSVRRQLFSSGERLRARHNSWHNLTGDGGEEEVEPPLRRHQSSSHINTQHTQPRADSPVQTSPAVRELLHRQELYIDQLEREATFCKDQLSTILAQVRDVLVTNTNEDQSKREEMMQLIKNIEIQVKTADKNTERQNCEAEGGEAVKKVREELEVLRLREAEAAEQVQRSIKVAEQIKQQKTEAEFEVSQLSSQVERQQLRIRTLIEEQVTKVEEERVSIERRYKDVIEDSKQELDLAHQETVRLTSSLEKTSRSESDLKRQLEDKERSLARLKEDMDRRVGELQVEVVEVTADRQTLEREINMSRLRLEKEKSEHGLEVERLQAEVAAVRGRLKYAEESLVEQRGQNLQMVEAVASLETELMNEKHRRENAEKRKLEEISQVKSEKNSDVERIRLEKIQREKKMKRENEQLEDLIKRQRSIIGELKSECKDVTGKFEDSYNSWLKERHVMKAEVSDLKFSMSELTNQVRLLEHQNMEHVQLQQSLLGQIQSTHTDKQYLPIKTSSSPLKINSSHKHLAGSEMKVGGTTRKKVSVSALKIERAGKVKHLITNIN